MKAPTNAYDEVVAVECKVEYKPQKETLPQRSCPGSKEERMDTV